MVAVSIMVAGAVALVVAWQLVYRGRLSVWPAITPVVAAAGLAALARGHLSLSGRVGVGAALGAGVAAGILLYGATAAFVLVVRRWHVFDRHVAEIYDQRRGISLGAALVMAAAVTACGEELFWRGLWQWRLASGLGWAGSAGATWAAYVAANLASGSLPIVAGAIVAGAAWGALALWTHGILASLLCHAVWTGLMIGAPPGGSHDRRRTGSVPAPPRGSPQG